MAKYVRCAYCGRRIDMHTDIVVFENDVHCDAWCFADRYGNYNILDEEVVKELKLQVYDDEEDMKQLKENIEQLKEKIRATTIQLKIAEAELAGKELVKI